MNGIGLALVLIILGSLALVVGCFLLSLLEMTTHVFSKMLKAGKNAT